METFSALLSLSVWFSRSLVNSSHKGPVTRSFDVFFDLHLNKQLNKQSRRWWFETPSRSLWRHCNEKGRKLRRGPCRLFLGRFGGSTSWQDSWTVGWWDRGSDRQRSDPRRDAAGGWSLKMKYIYIYIIDMMSGELRLRLSSAGPPITNLRWAESKYHVFLEFCTLTHFSLDKMVAISQTFTNASLWIKCFVNWFTKVPLEFVPNGLSNWQ